MGTNTTPNPDLAHLSDAALMERMRLAPDFGYDDEEQELTRRLKPRGLSWRWSESMFDPRVEVFKEES